MRHVTGAWNYRPMVLAPLLLAAPLALLLFGWRALTEAPSLAERLAALAGFGVAYGVLAIGMYRRASSGSGDAATPVT